MSTRQPDWQVVPHSPYQINSTAISERGERCVLGTSNEYDSGDFGVYCYDGYGTQLWFDPIGENIYQGVFWVAISNDARVAIAGGANSQSGDRRGFLTAYAAADGSKLLNETLTGRVNEVDISADGAVFVAATGNQLRLYRRQADGFELSDVYTLEQQYCISCGISADGARAVVGSYQSDDSSEGAAGMVQLFDIVDGKLRPAGAASDRLGKILRVAIVDDGSWWGASTHDGRCAAFCDSSSLPYGQAAWVYTPPDKNLSVAYAFAICKTRGGRVLAACGANEPGAGHGCIFAVDTVRFPSDPTGYRAKLRWLHELQYDPNPGVNMDGEARFVTATDGQPGASQQPRLPSGASESPGNFYLFDQQAGELLWQYPTSLMNWPMAISHAGNAVFAASDNGTAYYWRL